MTTACHLEPANKKLLIDKVGRALVARHGKQKFYSPAQVRQATFTAGYPIDYMCWAMVIFTTPADFSAFHDTIGEACDYAAMKSTMLADLAYGGPFSPFDIDLSWLEWPDIDLSALFDWW